MRSVLALILFGLTACAYHPGGVQQRVEIHSTPLGKAKCTISNDGGTWHAKGTPTTVIVTRHHSELEIRCHRGSMSGVTHVSSDAYAMQHSGNVLRGGDVGHDVDAKHHAHYAYPSIITVHMKPSE